MLKLFIASRNATINEVDFPAELGPSYVYASPEMIQGAVDKFLGIEASGGPRGSLERPKRRQAKKKGKASGKKQEEAEAAPGAKPKPPGSDGLVAGRAKPARWRRRRWRARSAPASPSSTRRRLPSGAAYVESNPYEHIQDPRVYHFKDTDGHRHGAYRMVAELDAVRRHPLLRHAGDPGLVGPADPRQPEHDQDDPRPRLRDLRRRRPHPDGRLAPGRQHLLGRERPAAIR